MPDFERIMFKDSYDLIWKSLTKGEKEIVKFIFKTRDGKAEDIKSLMKNPSGYDPVIALLRLQEQYSNVLKMKAFGV